MYAYFCRELFHVQKLGCWVLDESDRHLLAPVLNPLCWRFFKRSSSRSRTESIAIEHHGTVTSFKEEPDVGESVLASEPINRKEAS